MLDENATVVMPDGSAFGVVSLPLPADHWLYAEGFDEAPQPVEGTPTREQVWAAAEYAVRGATMRGKITDFDPDALCMNMVYALCGPALHHGGRPMTLKEISDDEERAGLADALNNLRP